MNPIECPLIDDKNLYLPKPLRDRIMGDLKVYFDDVALLKHLHADRGYKLMLGGTPGNLKSTFVLLIASKFHLPVFNVNLNDRQMGDEDLIKYVSGVPLHGLLLIEDMPENLLICKNHSFCTLTPSSDGVSVNLGVSKSCLLNAIQGILSKPLILVAAANHSGPFDPAIVRPGRLDRYFEFPGPDQQVIERYFVDVYSQEWDKEKPSLSGSAVREHASDFSRLLKDSSISFAALSVYLMDRRRHPERTLTEVNALLELPVDDSTEASTGGLIDTRKRKQHPRNRYESARGLRRSQRIKVLN